jgi:hypothetical protein
MKTNLAHAVYENKRHQRHSAVRLAKNTAGQTDRQGPCSKIDALNVLLRTDIN